MPAPEQHGFLRRAHRFLVYFGGVYAFILVLLLIPVCQRHLIYLHKLRWPLNTDFERPEKYGIAPQKALNVNITTADNVHLGAWFILSEAFYQHTYRTTSSTNLTSSLKTVSTALRDHPTVLYFHGNAGTRAVSFRVATYKAYTTRLNANVLAVDYRGFADSQGVPSEEGLVRDARAVWDWAVGHGARAENLVLVGQSLGTGVVAQFAQELAEQGKRPRGIVLVAPYSSLRKLLETYNILGWFPLLMPLQTIPMAQSFLLGFLTAKFDTNAILPDVKTDIMLVHAQDDFDIPMSHSATLFNTLLEPSLPPSTMTMDELRRHADNPEKWNEWVAGEKLRQQVKADLVRVEKIEGFGKINRFQRSRGAGNVVFFESEWGGHDRVGSFEGVVDLIGQWLFRLPK